MALWLHLRVRHVMISLLRCVGGTTGILVTMATLNNGGLIIKMYIYTNLVIFMKYLYILEAYQEAQP